MVERKDPRLGRGVVLGDGYGIQASRPKQLTLVLLQVRPVHADVAYHSPTNML
jgi:hypothetical protein